MSMGPMKQSTGDYVAVAFLAAESVALPPWGSSPVYLKPHQKSKGGSRVQGVQSSDGFSGFPKRVIFISGFPAVRVFPGCKPILL